MELEINQQNNLELKKVFVPVVMKTPDNEELVIQMRDGGFELDYKANGRVTLLRCVNGKLTVREPGVKNPKMAKILMNLFNKEDMPSAAAITYTDPDGNQRHEAVWTDPDQLKELEDEE